MKMWIVGLVVAMCIMAMPYARTPGSIVSTGTVPPTDDGHCNIKTHICWIDITDGDNIDITIDPPIITPENPTIRFMGGDSLPYVGLDTKGTTLQMFLNLNEKDKETVRNMADAIGRAQINRGAYVDDWTTRLLHSTKTFIGG